MPCVETFPKLSAPKRRSRFRTFRVAFLHILVLMALFSRLSALGQEMKLLTSESGWVVRGNTLYWTDDGGRFWRTITPKPPGTKLNGLAIHNVFFLNDSVGWAVISSPRAQEGPASLDEVLRGITIYNIARTVDGGRSWDFALLTYPELPDWQTSALTGPSEIFFVDSSHGWLVMAFDGNSKPGKLLATNDGGRSWKWVNSPGVSGSVRFTSIKDGWLVGGPARKLYATHDGCTTWAEVLINPPSQLARNRELLFFQKPPEIDNHGNGFVAAQYVGLRGTMPSLVVFSTRDSGMTWKTAKILVEDEDVGPLTAIPYAISDSVVIVSTGKRLGSLSLMSVPLFGEVVSQVKIATRFLPQLSFADAKNGFIQLPNGELLGTRDGGATSSNVTPWRSHPKPPHKANSSRSRNTLDSSALQFNQGAGGGVHISKHLAFDTSYVMSLAQMATWWKYSPYYDTFIYLPGSPNRGTDPRLGTTAATWVTPVINQGWGVTPIWFGLQPSCRDNTNIGSLISTNLATAASQGTAEADNAATAASNFGLDGTIIYKDVENYDTGNAQCADSVKSYLGAWISRLHKLGYKAAVYANPSPAQQQIRFVSPAPDAIWVPKYDQRATTWSLGALGDANWPSHQRTHQYYAGSSNLGDTQNFGGVSYNIDQNIEDAPVAGGNGTKTYSGYSVTSFDDPSAASGLGLNSINNAYLGKQLQAQVAGFECPTPDPTGGTSGCGIQFPNFFDLKQVGLYWDDFSAFTLMDFGAQTSVFGLNNKGLPVGAYYDSLFQPGHAYGFIATSTGAYSLVTCAGDLPTFPTGINDAGQTVGYFDPSDGGTRGFVLDSNGNCDTTSLTKRGASTVVPTGINGQGEIAGYYQDSKGNYHSFLWSRTDGWQEFSTPLVFQGCITNNELVVTKNTSQPIYDLAHQTALEIPCTSAYCDLMFLMSGLNDEAIGAGEYIDLNGVFHGALFWPNP